MNALLEKQNTLKRDNSLERKIDLQTIEVTPGEFISSKQFVKELEFPYVNDAYLRKHESTLGLFIYSFNITDKSTKLSWTIRRRVSDFKDLEKAVKHQHFYHFRSKEIQKESADVSPAQQVINIYCTHRTLHELHRFLVNIIMQAPQNPDPQLLMFLEISSVQYGMQAKYKECFMKKKAGGRYGESKCARCGTLWGKWDRRYFIISSESVMYSKGPDIVNGQIREVMTFDYNFDVSHGKEATGYETNIILKSSTRRLVINAPDIFVYFDFLYSLKKATESSQYMQSHRFDSFAPIRKGWCKWYVDGETYYQDVLKSIREAKYTVYITDWWLSPEFYLQRPVNSNETSMKNRDSRLDIVLKSVADRGVQVMILQYLEPTFALQNDSLYTKTTLEGHSPNIRVLRHPSQTIPFLYSHHEKMVIVDQKLGFMGGLDLCYGRMDNSQHLLYDEAFEATKNLPDIEEFWPGIDFSNSRTKDFYNVKHHWVCLLGDKREKPKMPWHDIAMFVSGEPVIDMSRHFIQYWNFVTIDMEFKKRNNHILAMTNYPTNQNESYIALQDEKQVVKSTFIGKEFEKGHFNVYLRKIEEEISQDRLPQYKEEEEVKDQSQYNTQEIELSKDEETHKNIHSTYYETNLSRKLNKSTGIQRRLSQAIQTSQQKRVLGQEYIAIMKKLQKQQQKVRSEEEVYYQTKRQKITHEISHQYQQLDFDEGEKMPLLQDAIHKWTTSKGTCQCQMLRSASSWSIGCKDVNTELSIQIAYSQLIQEAKSFIYIENQFFISGSAGQPVENTISEALINRIKQAAANKEAFKVIVFLPLLPGFEGEIDDPSSAVMKVQLHWEYATISRGGSSILEQLKKDESISDPSEYIEFYSLRQHGISPATKKPVTEIIYIHSKLMIVDDEMVLMGSANINDRSLLGSRDSEIAMVIQDEQKVNIVMGGAPCQVSQFAHTLRTNLYMEHFGMSYQQVVDPLNITLQERIRQQTLQNTIYYREIFACYPDDLIGQIADLEKFRKQRNLEKYPEYAKLIKGHAVQFPLNFLQFENLKIGIFNKEYLCPDINFT